MASRRLTGHPNSSVTSSAASASTPAGSSLIAIAQPFPHSARRPACQRCLAPRRAALGRRDEVTRLHGADEGSPVRGSDNEWWPVWVLGVADGDDPGAVGCHLDAALSFG